MPGTPSAENDKHFLLQNNRLTVEIATPGVLYRGTRFDWTALITQVTLDHIHTYCTVESLKPGEGSGGIGLCNEFGIDLPIGYMDAAPGDSFPKLGVGLLKKPDAGEYSFMRPYEITQPFQVNIDKTDDSAVFTVNPIDCRGYAVKLVKKLFLDQNRLLIEYSLENTGSQPILTNEYCHNFLAIDQRPVSQDYILEFPYPVQLENLGSQFTRMLPPFLRKLPASWQESLASLLIRKRISNLFFKAKTVGFKKPPAAPFYFRPVGFSKTDQFQWELRQHQSKVGIREYSDFEPIRIAVWGASHVISAEVFIAVELKPGENKNWTRTYEFFYL